MGIFRKSKPEQDSQPEAQRRKKFIPSLGFKFLRWRSKTGTVNGKADQTVDSSARSSTEYYFPFDAQRPASIHLDSDLVSTRRDSVTSTSSSVYSDNDQASVVSMPSLTTDETTPPDSPVDMYPEFKPMPLFARPATSLGKPISSLTRPTTSYELSPASPFSPISNFDSIIIAPTPFGPVTEISRPSTSTSTSNRPGSIFSHFSQKPLSIDEDTDYTRSSSAMATFSPFTEKSTVPTIAEEDCLVLTLTSKYPTGAAAELYVPEDLSYDVVMRKKKEARRAELRRSLTGKGDLFRRRSVRASDVKLLHELEIEKEKIKAKRMSVNF